MSGDMLVQLLKIERAEPLIDRLRSDRIVIKQASSFEMTAVVRFVRENWGINWADEVVVGFTRQPVSVFVAVHEQRVIGFCAYECTRRNYIGPMGVIEGFRGRCVGKALLLAALRAELELGYAYAIIGGVGPVDFYARACGAKLIEGSVPGVYTDRIVDGLPK